MCVDPPLWLLRLPNPFYRATDWRVDLIGGGGLGVCVRRSDGEVMGEERKRGGGGVGGASLSSKLIQTSESGWVGSFSSKVIQTPEREREREANIDWNPLSIHFILQPEVT